MRRTSSGQRDRKTASLADKLTRVRRDAVKEHAEAAQKAAEARYKKLVVSLIDGARKELDGPVTLVAASGGYLITGNDEGVVARWLDQFAEALALLEKREPSVTVERVPFVCDESYDGLFKNGDINTALVTWSDDNA